MSQPLPYDEIHFEKDIWSNKLLKTPHKNGIGFFYKLI